MMNPDEGDLVLPSHLPVMILPEATLFPHALMPLYLFEPKYRAMLDWVLARDRMFCIAMAKDEDMEDEESVNFHITAGAGVVRACRTNEDGTSHLFLQGIGRVKLSGFSDEHPFVFAAIDAITTHCSTDGDFILTRLRKALGLLQEEGVNIPPNLETAIGQLENPEAVVDLLCGAIGFPGEVRQELLSESFLEKRANTLFQHLGLATGQEDAFRELMIGDGEV